MIVIFQSFHYVRRMSNIVTVVDFALQNIGVKHERMIYIKIQKKGHLFRSDPFAVRTGLEPATLGVTGRYSNRLNYRTNFQYFQY